MGVAGHVISLFAIWRCTCCTSLVLALRLAYTILMSPNDAVLARGHTIQRYLVVSSKSALRTSLTRQDALDCSPSYRGYQSRPHVITDSSNNGAIGRSPSPRSQIYGGTLEGVRPP